MKIREFFHKIKSYIHSAIVFIRKVSSYKYTFWVLAFMWVVFGEISYSSDSVWASLIATVFCLWTSYCASNIVIKKKRKKGKDQTDITATAEDKTQP